MPVGLTELRELRSDWGTAILCESTHSFSPENVIVTTSRLKVIKVRAEGVYEQRGQGQVLPDVQQIMEHVIVFRRARVKEWTRPRHVRVEVESQAYA